MVDRTIPFGDPANAEYFTGEGGADPPDGNFVVAETAAGTKLMEWDATASEWVVRGDVNMSGQALAVDSVDANSVSTDVLNGTYLSAAQYSDNGVDGVLSAVADADKGDIVVVESGGGSGANGEYIMEDPGSSGFGVDGVPYADDLTITGSGTIKLADNSASDYAAMIRPGDGWQIKDITLDGNRANQTDGGVKTQQLGIRTQSNFDRIQNTTIKNTQYGPVRARTVDDVADIGNVYKNCGDGMRYGESGGDNALGVRIVGTTVLNSGGASAANTGGVIIGDGCNECSVSGVTVRGALNGALRIEESSNVSVQGGTFEGADSVVTAGIIQSNGVRLDATVTNTSTARGVLIDGGQGVNLDSVIRNVGGPAVVVDATTAHSITPEIFNPGGTPVICRGLDRGAKIEPTIQGAGNTPSGPAIRLEDDADGNPVKNVKVGGMVAGLGNLTYAVQASDANQTGLVDGLASHDMATGVVDNPGGLTVGDTL